MLAAPASAAVPARRPGACPGGERFASCRPAVYSANASVMWAVAAGDTGELRGHCLPPPSHQPQEDPPPFSLQGGDPNSGDTKHPHGQEGAALGQMVFAELPWAFPGPPSCPQGSSSGTQGQAARPPHSSQRGEPSPSRTL